MRVSPRPVAGLPRSPGAPVNGRNPPRASRRSEYDHLTPLLDVFGTLGRDDPARPDLHAALVTGFLPVVQHIARKFSGRGEPLDDLEQAGTVGLLGALDRFEPDRGGDFLSFAIPTITGEIRRHFRDRTWAMRVPRRLKDLQSAIGGAVGPLSQKLGRAPRPSEIAARLEVPVQDVLDGLEAQQVYRSASLDELIVGSETVLGDRLGVADAGIENVEFRETLLPLLDELPDRERTILLLRFFGNRTQTQIGEAVGISQMHVSRLLTATLATLRRRLGSEDPR